MTKSISDSLCIGVDISSYERNRLVVMRIKDNETYIINQFLDDEALELYNKLIGADKFEKEANWELFYDWAEQFIRGKNI